MKDASPAAANYLALIDRIYNVEHDTLGIMFTTVWVPLSVLWNMALMVYDGYRSVSNKRHVFWCVLDITLLILTVLMHLI